MRKVVVPAVFLLALLAIWEGLCRLGIWSEVLVPSPRSVANYLHHSAASGELWAATVVTSTRLLKGYLIGLAIGIPLGMLMARFRIIQETIGILALGLQTLPSVCWVPLSLLWFGISEEAMLFIVVMGTVWAVILATAHGIKQIPPIYKKAAATMGSKGLDLWLRVLLPASLPHVVSGTKQGWAFAWRSLMAAEIYVTVLSGFGLGHILHYGRELHAMDQVVGIMIIIVFIGTLAEALLFGPWERFLHKRWGLN